MLDETFSTWPSVNINMLECRAANASIDAATGDEGY
jgi:hypothetical protein